MITANRPMEYAMAAEEVLTTKETARLLRVSPLTLLKFIKEDSLPAHRMGRKWVFIRSEILDWLRNK